MNASASLNDKTRVVRACDTWLDDNLFFKLGFSAAVSSHADRLRECTEGFAVLAAAPRTGETVAKVFVDIAPGELRTLVVGRHERADISVRTDSSLSLRHAMVILKRDAQGDPFVRVLDLRSIFGVHDVERTPHLSLAANGPIALRLADTALFILPMSTMATAAAENLSQSTFDSVTWPALKPYVPSSDPERHLRGLSHVSRCTSAVSVITDMSRITPAASPPPGTAGFIALDANGQSYKRAVDQYSLRAGVLVGRYDRCDVNARNIEMPMDISRVHALMIAIDGRVHLFDAGSTNGIAMETVPIRQLALQTHHPTTVEIGAALKMTWLPLGDMVDDDEIG